MDSVIPADHRVKLKEHETINKYQDIARNLKDYGTSKWQ